MIRCARAPRPAALNEHAALVILHEGGPVIGRAFRYALDSAYAGAGFLVAGRVYTTDGGGTWSTPVSQFRPRFDAYAVAGMTAQRALLLQRWLEIQVEEGRSQAGRLHEIGAVARLLLSRNAGAIASTHSTWMVGRGLTRIGIDVLVQPRTPDLLVNSPVLYPTSDPRVYKEHLCQG